MSSVRLTTAVRVALTLRNVVVSRKGLSTMISLPHSTPIGAKLTAPDPSMDVTMLSMMNGISGSGSRVLPADGWRRVPRRLVRAGAAPPIQPVAHGLVALPREADAAVRADGQRSAVGARTAEEAVQHPVAVLGQHRLGVELHA